MSALGCVGCPRGEGQGTRDVEVAVHRDLGTSSATLRGHSCQMRVLAAGPCVPWTPSSPLQVI